MSTSEQYAAFAELGKVTTDALATFDPSPAFRNFIDGDDSQVAVRCANRTGKTRHAAYKVASYMVDHPGAKCRICGPSREQTHKVLGQYLHEFLAPWLSHRSYYVEGKGWNTNTIILRNGSTCQIKSYEDKPTTHAGDSLDIVILDEPPPRAHFAENQARTIDRDGQFILTFTAVNRPVGWLRRIVENEPGWVQYVAKLTSENCPWYSDEQMETFYSTFRSTPWQWAQRVEAEWEGITEGRVFSAFTQDNVTSRHPRGDVRVGIGIDHGRVAGNQVAVLVAWRGTQIWVVDEYRSSWGTTPEEDGAAILAMLQRRGVNPTEVKLAIGDTNTSKAGWRVNELIEEAIKTQLRRKGFPPFRIKGADKSPGSVDFGMRVLNHAAHRGDLIVHEDCYHVIDSLRNWCGGTSPGSTDAKLSHAADALRYILVGILGATPAYSHLRFL